MRGRILKETQCEFKRRVVGVVRGARQAGGSQGSASILTRQRQGEGPVPSRFRGCLGLDVRHQQLRDTILDSPRVRSGRNVVHQDREDQGRVAR